MAWTWPTSWRILWKAAYFPARALTRIERASACGAAAKSNPKLCKRVKARLRDVTLAGAQDLARRALACGSADEVRALLAGAAGAIPG